MEKAELIKTLKSKGVRPLFGGTSDNAVAFAYKDKERNEVTEAEIEASKTITLKEWRNSQKVLRFDWIGAFKAGKPQDAILLLKELGHTVLNITHEPIGDCSFCEVLEIIEPLPDYFNVSDYRFELYE